MHILIFHPALAPYRIDFFNQLSSKAKLTLALLRRVDRNKNFDTQLLLSKLCFSPSFLPRISLGPITIWPSSFSFLYRHKPTHVVTHEFLSHSAQIALFLLLLPAPPKLVIWTSEHPLISRSHSPFRILFKRLLLLRVNSLIVYSTDARDYFRDHLGFRGAIAVLPNISDPSLLRTQLYDSNLSCPDIQLLDTKNLLFVGRFSPEKNLFFLLRCFSIQFKDNPLIRLILVGSGPLECELRDLTCRLNIQHQVIFTGHLPFDKILPYYRLSSFLLLPSTYETFGGVVNDSLMSGVPVICSRNAGASTLIRSPSQGILIDPENELSLQSALANCTSQLLLGNKLWSYIRPNLHPQTLSSAVDSLLHLL